MTTHDTPKEPRSIRWRMALAVAVVALAAVALVGCGSSKSSTSSAPSGGAATSESGTTTTEKSHLATAKFVLHAGLAFGAFHRWIYKPFKAGKFTGGNLKNNKAAVVKGGLAGLFAYHEVKKAGEAAKASPSLSKLAAPVAALETKLKSIASGIKSGKVDPSAITSANGDTGDISNLASQAGAAVKDKIPSLGQVTSGASSG